MARVRIFLLTYRRPALLRRAILSLLAQTLTDWICELHNDALGDEAPQALLTELAAGDTRFIYCAHEINWGPVVAFNHAFAGGREPFASLLEDDNWWEPQFLETAVGALGVRPDAALAWSNMKVWQERLDGGWTDTGKIIWSTTSATQAVVEFRWPESLQAFDALHSNGAMVFRPDKFRVAVVPRATPFAIIEQLRERAATGPLLLLTTPLANFACTIYSARDADATRWLQAKMLVAVSFFQTVTVDPAILEGIWAIRRAQRPRDTDMLICLGIVLRDPELLAPARLGDWLYFLLHAMRHPLRIARGLRFRRDHPDVWRWIVDQTVASGSQSSRNTVYAKQL